MVSVMHWTWTCPFTCWGINPPLKAGTEPHGLVIVLHFLFGDYCFAFFVWRLFVTLYVFTCMYLGRTTFFSLEFIEKSLKRTESFEHNVVLLLFLFALAYLLHCVVFFSLSFSAGFITGLSVA